MEEITCIFCKIIQGEIPSHRVYEDEHILAFLDIAPKTKGHTLMILKMHTGDIFTTPSDDLKHIIVGAQKIAGKMKSTLGAAGVNLLQSNGRAAQQEVLHFHLHVIPRYEDDQKINFATAYAGTDLAEIAKRLCQND